jgi:hypothetical protein
MRISSVLLMLSLCSSVVLNAQRSTASWTKVYEALFSTKAPADADAAEIVLEDKFRISANPVKTQVALLLMKIDEERSSPKGVWADWILDSPEADIRVLSPAEKCSAMQQSAAAQFLARNFIEASKRYQHLSNAKFCSWDERDFAQFQSGWISVNLKASETAMKQWLGLLAQITARKLPSLHKLSVLKEATTLALTLQEKSRNASYFSRVKTFIKTDEDKNAFTEGAIDALSQYINNEKASAAHFQLLKTKLEHELEPERRERVFPTTKVSMLASPCLSLEWFPKTYDPSIVQEKAESCSAEISKLEKHKKLSSAELFEKSTERFQNCAECRIEVANLYNSIEALQKACMALMKVDVLQNFASKLGDYCSNKAVTPAITAQFFQELKNIDWKKIDAKNLLALSQFIRARYSDADFAIKFASFLEQTKSKNESSLNVLALDYLKEELGNHKFHEKILSEYSNSGTAASLKDWTTLSFAYTLEKRPVLESWKHFFNLDPSLQSEETRAALIQVSLDQLLRNQLSVEDVQKYLSREPFFNHVLSLVKGVSGVEVFSREERMLLSEDQFTSFKKFLTVQAQIREIENKLKQNMYSNLGGVEKFIRKMKKTFSLRTQFGSSAPLLAKVCDKNIVNLLDTYKNHIQNSGSDNKSFWAENPKIAEQILSLIHKWESTI